MIFTLLVFVVLMIFGTFILQFMVHENKMSLNHQRKTEAYYIARSGAVVVEAAILDMDEEEKKELMSSDMPLKAEVENLSFDNGILEYVLIRKENNNIVIESKGQSKGLEQIVEKVIVVEETSGGIGERVEIDHAVHSEGFININSGLIRGDVTSNKGPIEKAQWNGKIEGEEKILTPPREYPQPIFLERPEILVNFPEFPSYNPLVSKTGNWSTSEGIINSNKHYGKMQIPYNTTLILDAESSDINIWVEELIVDGTDSVDGNVKVIGNNKVNIHVKNRLSINSKYFVTGTSNPTNVNIFYSGSNIGIDGQSAGKIPVNLYLNPSNLSIVDINIKNSKFMGDLYVYRGNISMSGGGISFQGDIYSKKGNIKVANGNMSGNIYAEEGNIQMSDSGSIHGNIYSKRGDINILDGNLNGDIYGGAGNVQISGSVSMVGDIYSKKGDIKISGSGISDGSIYSREGNIEISGSGRIDMGNIYINGGDITFTGSGRLEGDIISSGNKNKINLDGGGSIINGLIYAPGSDISFKSSAKVYGAVVGNSLHMNNGGSLIEYRPNNFDFPTIDIPNTKPKLSFKSGHFK